MDSRYRTYQADVIEPMDGDCITAILKESGLVVHVSEDQKWWPQECVVGETIIYQPHHAVQFRPYDNKHYEHLRGTIALDELANFYLIENAETSEEEVKVIQNTCRWWIDYKPSQQPAEVVPND